MHQKLSAWVVPLALSVGLPAALSLASCNNYRTVGLAERVETSIGNGKTITAIGAGDLNGDGKADVVVVNSGDEVNVLISQGDGTLATGVAYPAEKLGNAPRNVTVADLNGDGKAEVVVGNIEQNSINVYVNQGDGRLVGSPAMGVGCKPIAVNLYDVNGDGRPDFVILCRDPNQITIYKNNGSGGFAGSYSHSWELQTSPGNSPAPRALAIGDLNGDGMSDYAVGTDNDLRILNSPKENQRDYKEYVVSQPLMSRVNSVGIGDLNGNDVADVTAVTDQRAALVFEYASGGTYSQYAAYNNLATNGRGIYLGMAITQLAGDDKSDMLLALSNQPELKIVVSRGEKGPVDAPAAASYVFSTGVQTGDNCFALGDVSGDGRPDVVLRNNNKVAVFLNASN